ncbi:MAG TPA: dienelactone hydrolase family protein [Bryobacteraceae bacterium]|nr:dienelactone hydrolase family protein [Bryobacteraceae bacterium]
MMNDPIANLIHLHEDGALSRRDVIQRLTKLTGSVVAALSALESVGLGQAQQPSCLTGVRVSETDPAVLSQMLTLYGEGGPLFAYQSLPRDYASARRPAVLVIHENQGLTEHIKDVNRRVAKAGYVAIAVDLLSRQGGTANYPDPQAAAAAYNRTTAPQRLQDMLSALYTIRDQVYVRRDRLGVVGFCAGGGSVYDLALNTDQLKAAVAFYGPPPAPDQLSTLNAPLLGLYAELDRNITGRAAGLVPALNTLNKTYELHIYEKANHAFHNDTGPRYEPAAACDAWSKTLAFFERHLNEAG